MSNKYRLLLVASLMGSLALAATAFAQTTNQANSPGWGFGRMGHMGMHQDGIFGTVATINGNTLTVTSKTGPKNNTTATTYTVDATNATINKNSAISSVSNIAVGDTIMVQGTVNGTNVIATAIRDGMSQRPNKAQNPFIQGNGQPVIAGTISVISGNILTIKNTNVTYTVDATNATVTKNNASSSLSSVAVGDNVIIQGTVNGTDMTASLIIDHAAPTTTSTTQQHSGFFGSIGNFFKHLFGF